MKYFFIVYAIWVTVLAGCDSQGLVSPGMAPVGLSGSQDSLSQAIPDTFSLDHAVDPGDEIQPGSSPAVGCDSLVDPSGSYQMSLSVSYNLPAVTDSITANVRAYGQEVHTHLGNLDQALYQVVGWQSSIIHNNIQGDSLYFFISVQDPHTPYQGNTWDRPQIQFNLWTGGQVFKRVGAYFQEGTIQPSRAMNLLQTLAVIQAHQNHDQLFMSWSGLSLAELRAVKNYYVGQCLTGSWANFVGLGVDSSFYLDFHDVLGWDKVQL